MTFRILYQTHTETNNWRSHARKTIEKKIRHRETIRLTLTKENDLQLLNTVCLGSIPIKKKLPV